jgi:hypothetical protein
MGEGQCSSASRASSSAWPIVGRAGAERPHGASVTCAGRVRYKKSRGEKEAALHATALDGRRRRSFASQQ